MGNVMGVSLSYSCGGSYLDSSGDVAARVLW